MIAIVGILLLSLAGMLHTYLLYPWLVRLWVGRRQQKKAVRLFYDPSQQPALYQQLLLQPTKEQLPTVAVLMAVHNEEKVLAEKLASLLLQDYPGPYQIWIGSDQSTDATNAILKAAAAQEERLVLRLFDSRQGKPNIINQLAAQATVQGVPTVFLLTDASVMLAPDTVSQLLAPMIQNPAIAMADARMIHTGLRATGISQSEDQYIHREVKLKQAEGQLWGYTIGPFGGCYALRATYFEAVPTTFLVDDFFLCLSAYAKGGRGISVATAHCYEAVGQEIQEEFKRKVRISAGNWQNARHFHSHWWPPKPGLAFAFFSHKILRWLTPILLLLYLLSLSLLGFVYHNYWAVLAFSISAAGLLVVPLVDLVLEKYLAWHWLPLRSLRYFIAMNLALLIGLLRYLKGIQSNVWQPSKRY